MGTMMQWGTHTNQSLIPLLRGRNNSVLRNLNHLFSWGSMWDISETWPQRTRPSLDGNYISYTLYSLSASSDWHFWKGFDSNLAKWIAMSCKHWSQRTLKKVSLQWYIAVVLKLGGRKMVPSFLWNKFLLIKHQKNKATYQQHCINYYFCFIKIHEFSVWPKSSKTTAI